MCLLGSIFGPRYHARRTDLPFPGVRRSVSDATFDLAADLERGRHMLCTSLRDEMDVLPVEHSKKKHLTHTVLVVFSVKEFRAVLYLMKRLRCYVLEVLL